MTDDALIYSVIFITLFILLLIAGVAITMFVAQKNRLAQDMQITRIHLDFEQEMRTVQQEVQEQVLNNVANELHDNIGQLLTVIHTQLEQHRMMFPETSAPLNPIRETLTKTIQQVRFLGRAVSSELLEQKGLLHAIQNEVTRMEQFRHFRLHWNSDGAEPALDKNQRLMAFRMFQEMINNTLKHSEAENIYVTLRGRETFELSVKDDGKGFDLNETLRLQKGEGLKNMRKRAALARLNCTIIAEEGRGCMFLLEKAAA